jgi:hypothetical protein
MAEEHAADTRFDRLLALTQDAFTDRHYPTAYYTLVAAMCEAEATQDVPRLLLVQSIAEAYAAPGERPVAALPLPPLTYRTLLTLLAKRIHNKILLIQRWRLRHDRPPDC